MEDGKIARNPCRNIGKLLAKVKDQQSEEVSRVDSWTRQEVAALLEVARAREPNFYPLLLFLLSTGCRKGEALGLRWQDVDFADNRIEIRRALVRGKMGTPKSGKARPVVLSPALADALRDLLAERRQRAAEKAISQEGNPEPLIPDWVFCSATGGPLDERNVTRSWHRVRREEETDLGFLDFGGTRRHPRGTRFRAATVTRKPLRATPRRGSRNLEHETGLEPATPTLATWMKGPRNLRNPTREPLEAARSRSCVPVWARSGHADGKFCNRRARSLATAQLP